MLSPEIFLGTIKTKEFTKDQNFQPIQIVLQAENERRQVPRQKSKKLFVSVSLHWWSRVSLIGDN